MNQPGRCVFVANGQIQAQQIQSFLQAEGITSVLRGESLSKTHGLTLDGLGTVGVFVDEKDEQRARALLASAEAGELRLADDANVDARRNETS
jgi:putative signal transducing protein